MVLKVLILYYLLSLFSSASSFLFPYVYPRIKLEAKSYGDAGEPLIITPYLKSEMISLAQNLSRVSITEKLGVVSHAGFFTVDEKYNSSLYFWYFPPFSKNTGAPVLLWLQGGPGGSSLFGLFSELGPLRPIKGGFALRKYHWALNAHLIFIDNPVGTGFSFTNDDKGYCSDETCIGKSLYNALQQFFTLFPKLRDNKFYISGESYAGKYIPVLGMEIHRQNSNSNEEKINLKGLAMGDAYCDPVNQIDYGNYLYQHGLLDQNQCKTFEILQNEIVGKIKQENWKEACILMDKLMDGEFGNFSFFKNFTGFNNYYNFLITEEDDEDMIILSELLNSDEIRRSVHVGGLPFNSGEEVQLHLIYDILKSVVPDVAELLSHYRILFYNGQLDIIVAYPLTVNFLRNLKFSSADEYERAPRSIWRVGDDIAGYVKTAGNLTEVLVRNAGHMVPKDQPKWAFDMITRFMKNNLHL